MRAEKDVLISLWQAPEEAAVLLGPIIEVPDLKPDEARHVLYRLLECGQSVEQVRSWVFQNRTKMEARRRLCAAQEAAGKRLRERILAGALSFWASVRLRGRWFREAEAVVGLLGDPEEQEEARPVWDALSGLANPWTYLPDGLREEVEGWAVSRAKELREEALKIPETKRLGAEWLRDSREWVAEFEDRAGRRHRVRIEARAAAGWSLTWDRDVDEYAPGPAPAGAKTDPGLAVILGADAGIRVEVDGEVVREYGLPV